MDGSGGVAQFLDDEERESAQVPLDEIFRRILEGRGAQAQPLASPGSGKKASRGAQRKSSSHKLLGKPAQARRCSLTTAGSGSGSPLPRARQGGSEARAAAACIAAFLPPPSSDRSPDQDVITHLVLAATQGAAAAGSPELLAQERRRDEAALDEVGALLSVSSLSPPPRFDMSE